MNFATITELEQAETKALISFYNEHNPERPVKKFSDRQTALNRCIVVWNAINFLRDKPTDEDAERQMDQAQAVAENEDSDAPKTPKEAEEKKNFIWPFSVPNGEDHRHGERRASSVDVPVKTKPITAPMAGMLRLLAASTEPAGWVLSSSILLSEAHKSAYKALVIAKLAEHNGVEGEQSAIRMTQEGYTAFKELPDDYGLEVKEKRPLSHASNAAGIAASWDNPEVRAARLKRDAVSVTVDGKTTNHKSVGDAFKYYRLMVSKYIRFRLILKEHRKAIYEEGKKEYRFAIIEATPETVFDKR